MKRKILAALIAVLFICVPLTACNESYRNPEVGEMPDSSYVVLSNGGSAVQYGKYVYFINGYRGYDDEDGKQNVWNKVIKGGLYRTELKGTNDTFEYTDAFGITKELKTFKPVYDNETEGYFALTTEKDVLTGYEKDDDGNILYDDDDNPIEIREDIDVSDSRRIASKTVGTSGYASGGIFIYDDYVYYASPSDNQNREGNFETSKTKFYRTKLDGSETIRVYTTTSDSSSSEYAFYKQGDNVYLVVHDGTSLVSVEIGKKVNAVKELAADVTGVLLPVRSVYYKGIDTNSVEDFVYYTRAITEEDSSVRAGNIVTAMRPDGSEQAIIFANGNTITLKNVDKGFLFYEDARNTGTVISYSNLHAQLYGPEKDDDITDETAYSPTYRAAYKSNFDNIKAANGYSDVLSGHLSGDAVNIENISNYTEVRCYRESKTNSTYAICYDSSGIYNFDGINFTTIYSGSIDKLYGVYDQFVFFRLSEGDYCFTNAFVASGKNTVYTLGEDMNTTATFGLDVVGDFAMMFGTVDEYASDYAMFVNWRDIKDDLSFSGTAKQEFVGFKTSEDKYDPTVELNESEEDSEG